MKGFRDITGVFLLAGLVAGTAVGQGQEVTDKVVIQEKTATRKASGTVLKEDWDTVELDRDGDGRADVSFNTEDVSRVEYGSRQPRYILEAVKLRLEPAQLEEKLRRAYVDDATPKYILQHAYYKMAETYAEVARKDPRELPKAVTAYEKLFKDIPDSRYAVSGRIELGNLLLENGKREEAVRHFEALAGGKFGPNVARRGKLLVARVEMDLRHYERAERLLTELSAGGEGGEVSQEVKLLRARSLVGQNKLDEGQRLVETVFAENPSNRVLGMAYGVLGDLFLVRKDLRTALTAYLKVKLMYVEAEPTETSHAIRQAVSILEKLGRTEDAAALKKENGG